MYTATGFRSLSDIDRSTAANDGQASTLFSATKNPRRIPANTPPVFRGLRSRICPRLLRLITNVNAGQAPSHNYFNNLVRSLRLWLHLLNRGPDQEIVRRIVVG